MIPPGLATWCEVDAAALAHNVAVFRARLADGARLGVVVKSNGYGHGLLLSARVLAEAGADWLIVNSVDEAQELRAGGLELPIYICGPILPARAADVVASGARVVAYGAELVAALDAAGQAAGQPVSVHVKVETGNNRQGLGLEAAVALGRDIASRRGVVLEGLATHYADIEDTTDHAYARAQLDAFDAARGAFAAAGLEVAIAHSANSAAAILWPETHGDLCRVGIAAYGLWPSTETYVTALSAHARGEAGLLPELRPALTWRCRVAQVKDVPADAYVGYGRTYRTTHASRIAVLPVGYHEGYDRRLSNLGHVLVDGRRAPIRGRVCMNMTMVDVTHVPSCRPGSIATLLGSDGAERVSAEQLGAWMGSINYEVVSRIHPDVARVA